MHLHFPDGGPDEEVEHRLRSSQPTPSEGFVADLEDRLFPKRAAASAPSRRPLVAGACAVGAMTAVALGFGLVQQGPLAPAGDDSAKAETEADCRIGPKREPVLVTKGNGDIQVRYGARPPAASAAPCP